LGQRFPSDREIFAGVADVSVLPFLAPHFDGLKLPRRRLNLNVKKVVL
jgi:hypothetical protein